MLDNLYKNRGGKIKNLAKWIFIIEAIGAIITGLIWLDTDVDLILYGLFNESDFIKMNVTYIVGLKEKRV